ncbi:MULTISPECIES: DEAD/DEAH box helicase [unclassified Enterococcus]|uniref:DEAD/DEAH box helicase n=1 Tax=unclassified Enterococcus TaxID=2608891 RepID=UPI001556EF4A|nr:MULTISPECIES: DEAD/DEAH box helicase [unclassified Enterococcus]MBS7576203.1 DEAD/DEAH box helicase [Enterococcus sp. MMGLQ5-2]MBS7583436.1 DEAD/DEAH box helicase [Enterococcus sp. MMGLQ5-1]NPD11296.1 DEAD/DEAH box helicase [Enterococcus sp. MMGLQ5-1]NPD36039.1 DEAD/DEAH box helicase [Enterococcus sp. MMGLQ5-2]
MEKYYGRRLVKKELPDQFLTQLEKMPSMIERGTKIQCQRCGALLDKALVKLPDHSFYCPACIVMGRVKSSESLYYYPELPKQAISASVLNWQGQLTAPQSVISKALVSSTSDILVHAVTGAGKTEMIYQRLAKGLMAGEHICLTSPRVDVCIEIYQRLTRDFKVPIRLLYAHGDEYEHSNLVVCTVNQLMRFYQSFDLIIVDEVDAFPLVNNPNLMWAIDKAKKSGAQTIYLTATPTVTLKTKVASGELEALVLAKRFHGFPLVLPKFKWCSNILGLIQKGSLPRKIHKCISKQRLTRFPLLIFMPEIKLGKQLRQILQGAFPSETIGFIASESENRKAISQRFKSGEYTILIATTVLERGVTFSKIDCLVIASHHRIFTTESLVQIAGRVGRDKRRPTGQLIFFHQGRTRAMKQMYREIQQMNREV